MKTAFVSSSAFVGAAVSGSPAALSARAPAPAARPATISMAVKDFDKWKTQWAGGFPGGEGFFKQWLEEGMKGEVPGLETELQTSNPVQGSSIVPVPPTPSDASIAAAARLAGKPVPAATAAAPEATAAAAGPAAAAAPVKIRVGGNAPTSASVVSAPTAASASAVAAPAATPAAAPADDGPDPALYMKNYAYFPVNVAPGITIQYDKTGARSEDKVGLAMETVEASAADLYFPAVYRNKAPVIKIDYVPGSPYTAGVGVSMQGIEGPPTLPAPAAAGEVTTSLKTNPSTGNLKLDFSVDGETLIQ